MRRWLKLLGLLCIAWVVMTTTHELGHVVGGILSGGTLQSVDLYPWHLPYSLFAPNPHPLVTLWLGPLLGAFLPLAVAALMRRPSELWFIANFCILANGLYLALGWYAGDRYLDTAQLIAHGTSRFWLALYCITTIPYGYIAFRHSCRQTLQPWTFESEKLQQGSNGGSTHPPAPRMHRGG